MMDNNNSQYSSTKMISTGTTTTKKATKKKRKSRRKTSADPEGFISVKDLEKQQKPTRPPPIRIEQQLNDSAAIYHDDSHRLQHKQQHHHPDIKEVSPFLGTSAKSAASSDGEIEYEELAHDTFSFLMTAVYPCEKQLKLGGKTKKNNRENSVEGNTSLEEEDEPISGSTRPLTTEEVRTKNQTKLMEVKADKAYLPFVTGLVVIVLQIFIYVVVFINTIRQGEPPNADLLLRLAQAFALMVALYTQSDLVDAVFMLTEGSNSFDSITTPFKFGVSNLCRLVAGNLGIISSFVLVIYSPDVIDLLLNFTAIEFVATLDDAAFALAAKGFLGINLEKKAKEVEDFRYEFKIRRKSRVVRVMVYLFYFLAYALSFMAITILQANRNLGVDNEIYVQLDDEVPTLFGISGVYIGCSGYKTWRNGKRYTDSIGYVDASYNNICPELKKEEGVDELMFPANTFLFCLKEGSWVFIKDPTAYPCDESGAVLWSFNEESKPSDAYDILSHADADWFVKQEATQGEILIEDVIMKPAGLFKISYNCTDSIQVTADIVDTVFRTFQYPLPASYYPRFETDDIFDNDDSLYVNMFSLVYRQVFLGPHVGEDVFSDLVSDVSLDCENLDPLYTMTMFDGLRWHYLSDFSFEMFVDWAKEKFEDAAQESDSKCAFEIFLKYYLRDKSWMLNKTIALPEFISAHMKFLSPSDTGGPSRFLEWFESAIVFDPGLVLPGRSTRMIGTSVEASCNSQAIECSENEHRFDFDVRTGLQAEETALLVKRNPSFQLVNNSNFEEYFTLLETNSTSYDSVEMVPISKGTTVISLPEKAVKDYRFQDRQTRYQLQTCVPFETGSTYCIDVVVLNRLSAVGGLVDFNLGFASTIVRSRGDVSDCRYYILCHMQLEEGGDFEGLIIDPREDCSYADFLEEYPGIEDEPVWNER